MSNRHIHIVTHDVPYPADIGGLIDIFYKIVWLHKTGIKIHLHCFTNNDKQEPILNQYCEEVYYYKRKNIISLNLPFIVSSRKSNALLINLQKDNLPILFEGLHSTYYLNKNLLGDRQIFIRLFNTEHIYYDQLAKFETNFLKKIYYTLESKLLKKYEERISDKAHLLALSNTDVDYYKNEFNAQQIDFLPVFLPYENVISHTGKGSYCLYQANLSINENEKVALWLIEKVFATIKFPLIISGKKPKNKLLRTAKKFKNISIVDSPTETNIQLLIQNAHINVLPSFNKTGVKLKLLNALFNGRHCLVDDAGVAGSALDELCSIANNEADFIDNITSLIEISFTHKEIQQRSAALKKLYNNKKTAILFSDMLQ